MQPIQNNYEPTQPQPPLPDHPTAHPLYHMVEHFINQGDWQAARAPLEELLTLYPDDPYLQELAPSVRTARWLRRVGVAVAQLQSEGTAQGLDHRIKNFRGEVDPRAGSGH